MSPDALERISSGLKTVHSVPFPVLRWAAMAWLVVWLPAYVRVWGWTNLLHLCDIAVLLGCIGLWLGSPLLISSQAVSSLIAGGLWCLDVGWRLVTGRSLVGGTDYMWDARYPLWVRLLSAFHVGLPVALLWGLRKLGYDHRGLALQATIAAGLLIAARFLPAELNLNYSYRDPVLHRAWGVAPVHLLVTFTLLVAALYWPTHLLLSWLFPVPTGSKP
jgi:hypothetical protein